MKAAKLIMSIAKYETLYERLEELLLHFEPIELLTRLSWLTNFEGYEIFHLREIPITHFITSLCLKHNYDKFESNIPTNEQISELIDLTEECLLAYVSELMTRNIDLGNVSESAGIQFAAKLAKMNGDINPNIYPYQIEYIRQGVLDPFAEFFVNTILFSPEDAWNFCKVIIHNYSASANNSPQETYSPVIDQNDGDNMPPIFSYPDLLKQMFLFEPEDFVPQDQNVSARFAAFIQNLSCQFGDESPAYNDPMMASIVNTRPIIKVGEKYFTPSFSTLAAKLGAIFEAALVNSGDQKTLKAYQENKAEFTEHSTADFFARVFPTSSIFRQLYYDYEGKRNETDLIIKYDSKVLIIEIKSGLFTPPARRGAPERLKTDLRKLIGNAYEQSNRTLNFIQNEKEPIFTDNNRKELLRIDPTVEPENIFLINVTFENLMNLATFPARMASLGFLPENVRFWSVNFMELETITQYLTYPSLLLNYIKSRIDVVERGMIYTTDELGYFGYYLIEGGFSIPQPQSDEDNPDLVVLSEEWMEPFDNYYIGGSEPPQLNIEPIVISLIALLEVKQIPNYTDLVSALIELPPNVIQLLTEKLLSLRNLRDGNEQIPGATFVVEKASLGITVLLQPNKRILHRVLRMVCAKRQRNFKMERWIGLGLSVAEADINELVNAFVFLKTPP